jgi:hypothetical protein
MIALAAFPFLVDPGVNLTLYLYRDKADHGAHTVTASEIVSPDFGAAMKSFSDRSRSCTVSGNLRAGLPRVARLPQALVGDEVEMVLPS